MKYIILAACFLVMGYLSHGDKLGLVQDMQTTCHRAYYTNSGGIQTSCNQLIDRIEQNNKLEVLAENGIFWVEAKGE